MLFKTPEQLHASLLTYYVHTIFASFTSESDASPHHSRYRHHNPQTPRHNTTTGPAESSSTSIHSLVITEGNRVRRRNLFTVREDIIPYMPQEWHTYHVLPLRVYIPNLMFYQILEITGKCILMEHEGWECSWVVVLTLQVCEGILKNERQMVQIRLKWTLPFENMTLCMDLKDCTCVSAVRTHN